MEKILNQVDRLRKKLFDTEVSLHFTQEDMHEVSFRLLVLNKLYKDLIYNVDLHRSGNVITSINGYKKTLEDIEKTGKEIEKMSGLQRKLEEKLAKLVIAHTHYSSLYESTNVFEETNKVLSMEDYEKRKKNSKRND